MQRKYVADTQLRRGRMERLVQKQQEAQEEEHLKLQQFLIPDGPVETTNLAGAERVASNLLEQNKEDSNAKNADEEPIKLPKLRSCYVCKARFRELHSFYDQMCPPCAALNWEKRHQTADLSGRVAVVTGSRVKIGYQTCLKLLRSGCTVVATTRFPNSAVASYRQEADFDQWQDRLQIYGLDLRDVTGLEAFTRYLKLQFADCGLDILINNACQTVRRPRAYYLPLLEQEQTLWSQADNTHKALLQGCTDFERVRRQLLQEHQSATTATIKRKPLNHGVGGVGLLLNGSATAETSTIMEADASHALVTTVHDEDGGSTTTATTTSPFETTGVSHASAMSQMIILPEDVGVSDSILPPGITDVQGQQLDLRQTNSWLLKMDQVSTPEVMECMFINAIAPFVLNSRLKPLMTIPNDHPDRYIINVSAMEGKFYRYKMANHPHTNMAKAALNMMTRTSAEDLAKNHRIYMNSVDTGWINDENPLERANKTAKTNLFQTPIDELDAAARILDPIFSGVTNSGQHKEYGKFLKDYRETEW